MKYLRKPKKPLFPGWLFVIAMVLYNELMLHFWITENFLFGRIVVVLAFGLGFGAIFGLITSFFPSPKVSKWVAVGLSFLVVVIYLTEYFLSDAYKTFMTVETIFAGAGGVAQDYMSVIMSLLTRNLWRIGLMLLPIVVYALRCRSGQTGWAIRGILAGAALVLYLLGFGAVHVLTRDAAVLNKAYNFDTAVRCMGLNMGLSLDVVRGSATNDEPEFTQMEVPTVATEATEPTVSGEVEVEPTEPIVYGDNVMNLDFDTIISESTNANITAIHKYVSSLTPTKKNEYTGLFEGKNLILITAEAFTAEVIDPELTPTLYRMANEGIKFNEYYQPAWGASTTSGEYSNLFGLVPFNGGTCMKNPLYQKMFLTMGFQLTEEGYHSAAYHNHFHDFYDRNKTHNKFGYENFYARYGGLNGITAVWPESDLEMIDISIADFIDKQPFNIYYMTVSGHCPYGQKENAMTRKNWDKVQHLEYSDTIKGYFAANLELEYAMASLIRQLEEAGIADDTVIALATDHYPYGLERSTTWKNGTDRLAELFGVEEYDQFVRDHNALIIWSGCIEDMDIVVDEPVYSLDILPTLSNLFGVEYDSRLLVGRDVFSGADPLVLWPDHSWLTELGSYNFKAGVFTPREGVQVPEGYVEQISAIVANKITYSRSVQQQYYFRHLEPYVYPDEQ